MTEHSLLTPFGVLNWHMQPSTPKGVTVTHSLFNSVVCITIVVESPFLVDGRSKMYLESNTFLGLHHLYYIT